MSITMDIILSSRTPSPPQPDFRVFRGYSSMSRSLQTALIFLCLMAGAYFVIASANELYDLCWKLTR